MTAADGDDQGVKRETGREVAVGEKCGGESDAKMVISWVVGRGFTAAVFLGVPDQGVRRLLRPAAPRIRSRAGGRGKSGAEKKEDVRSIGVAVAPAPVSPSSFRSSSVAREAVAAPIALWFTEQTSSYTRKHSRV